MMIQKRRITLQKFTELGVSERTAETLEAMGLFRTICDSTYYNACFMYLCRLLGIKRRSFRPVFQKGISITSTSHHDIFGNSDWHKCE